jgi:predicted metalloprotease with PDZ domain
VPKDLAGHLFNVTVTVAAPAADGQVFALPAWIPGSYMIREFARNIVRIRAESGGQPVALAKLDKHSWRAAPVRRPADPALRGVCLGPVGARRPPRPDPRLLQRHQRVPARARAGSDAAPGRHPAPGDPAARNWRVATSLPELGAKRYGFGTYVAADYDELIDHPVEMGDFALAASRPRHPHDIVITGRVPNLDMARLQQT